MIKGTGKKSTVVPKSGLIIDPGMFRDTSTFTSIKHWFKNRTALSDINRTFNLTATKLE
jgi:hypothetical protein